MVIETNSDKQAEPRLLSEAETDAVAGGNTIGTYAVYLAYRRLHLPPPPPCPCSD